MAIGSGALLLLLLFVMMALFAISVIISFRKSRNDVDEE